MSGDLGLVFDGVAEEYDRVRRGYPAELVDTACAEGGLVAGSKVVEVGCGTGKLTGALVERGLEVDAVDPGAQLVEVARRRVGEAPVRFHLGRFEEVELPEGAFDAVFSATAFHWVDPAVGWSKVARLLRPEGVVALLTHIGVSGEHDEAFLAAWREVQPESSWVYRELHALREGAETRLGNVSELWGWLTHHDLARPEAARLFDRVRFDSVRIDLEESVEKVLALVRTTSSYLRLEPEPRARLERRITEIVASAGGLLSSTLLATLVTARAVPG